MFKIIAKWLSPDVIFRWFGQALAPISDRCNFHLARYIFVVVMVTVVMVLALVIIIIHHGTNNDHNDDQPSLLVTLVGQCHHCHHNELEANVDLL